jgi:hypothetical protein
MLLTIQAVGHCESISMNGLAHYWGDLNHRPEDAAQGPLPLIDPNMQMTVWIPVYSPHASVAPVLFPRANTASTPVCDGRSVRPQVGTLISR